MRINVLVAALLSSLFLACSKPQLAPVPPPQGPLHVAVHIRVQLPSRAEAEQSFAESLRDRIAAQARIRPAGEAFEGGDSELRVEILDSMARGDVVKESALKAFSGSVEWGVSQGKDDLDPRDELMGGFYGAIFGLVVAPAAATGSEARGLYHNVRLGYKPRHLICRVTLRKGGGEPLVVLETTPWDVVKAMRPMTATEARQPGALQREEAEALAKVISENLASVHGWPIRGPQPEPPTGQP